MSMILRFIFIAVILNFTGSLIAQVGIQFNTNLHQLRYNGTVLSADFEDDSQVGTELALNYWFRLPKQRVEFLPTLYAGFTPKLVEEQDIREFGAELKTNIYPFDFGGDCDCPTFGKQSPGLQKGLFIQLTLGYAVYNKPELSEVVSILSGVTSGETSTSGFTFGGGAGIDIGVTNFFTITPIVGIRRGTVNITDSVVSDNPPFEPSEIKTTTIQAGIRATFRFDHKQY